MKSAILFIVFNRPETTAKVFAQIRREQPQHLYVAADGPRANKEGEKDLCNQVREIVKSVDWDCEVKYLFRDQNLGCGKGVRGAIDWFFENVEEGIILEDDVLPDPTFFGFCEELLERFRNDQRVGSISGSNLWGGFQKNSESYSFSNHASIWGWATWKDRWQKSFSIYKRVEERDRSLAEVCDHVSRYPRRCKQFWTDASRLFEGLDTWDYQWCMTGYDNHFLVVRPRVNMVANIGFGEAATHTKGEAPALYRTSQPLTFPLVHPRVVRQDLVADEYLERVWLGPQTAESKPKKRWKSLVKKAALWFLRKAKLENVLAKLLGQARSNGNDNSELQAHDSSLCRDLTVVARMPGAEGRPRVLIGKDCIISGNFVFEKETGSITIGNRTFIGGCHIISVDEVAIGDDVMISWGCSIVDNNAHSLDSVERSRDVDDALKGLRDGQEGKYKDWSSVKRAPVQIDDRVWIGFNSIILKGVHIGTGSIVAAGSVVTKSVPSFSLVAGNPAKVIRSTR